MRLNRRSLLVLLVVLFVPMGAVAVVWNAVDRAISSRQAQFRTGAMTAALVDLESAPLIIDPTSRAEVATSRARIRADEAMLALGLAGAPATGGPAALVRSAKDDLAAIEWLVTSIYRTSVQSGSAGRGVSLLYHHLRTRSSMLARTLAAVGRADAAAALTADRQAKLADIGPQILLLVACAFLVFRWLRAQRAADRLARENELILGVRRDESRTDVLTNLGNRRALSDDLASVLEEPGPNELLLAMLDLDGFKQYNDTFGHAAGDALLQRLGLRLSAAAAPHDGWVYRIGGDEFCVFARISPDRAEQLLSEVTAALQDGGDGWRVGCSLGAAWMPSEAGTEAEAMQLADERMYAHKAGRSSASQQITDALLQVLVEQNLILDDHVERVGKLAGAVARVLGQPDHEIRRIHLAARLHDIGKTAIPAAILNKPGPLDEHEWGFIRQHPLIGERIVLAAPALAHTAPLIRSSHERVDGTGYPDQLAGLDIPLGARIIAVCDAFDAMTSDRLYAPAVSPAEALAELERHAGTQFDADVVAAFITASSLHEVSPVAAPAPAKPAQREPHRRGAFAR